MEALLANAYLMNSEQAKQIPLDDLLGTLGHMPKSQRGTDMWYLSPFRDEQTASFKLNKRLNTWYDFGLGQGGTVIDFVCTYYNDTVKQALERLEQSTFSSSILPSPNTRPHLSRPQTTNPQQTKLAEEKKKAFVLEAVTAISESALLQYLQSRCINLNIAKQYLKQVYFRYGEQGHRQYALGFANDAGCYELRNARFKGFIAPPNTTSRKTVTSINIHSGGSVAVFEGFTDFLSFLTDRNITELQNSVIVLNSVSAYKQCQQLLQQHTFSKVYFFLDNDQAGKDTLNKLTSDLQVEWVDMSQHYAEYEDYNAYLQSKHHPK